MAWPWAARDSPAGVYPGGMPRPRVPGPPADDLHDYLRPPAPRPGRRRGDKAAGVVTDDWPAHISVAEAEIAVVEAWFGDLFDRLFGPR